MRGITLYSLDVKQQTNKQTNKQTSGLIKALWGASSLVLHLLMVSLGIPISAEKGAKQKGSRIVRSPSSSAGLDRFRFSSIFP